MKNSSKILAAALLGAVAMAGASLRPPPRSTHHPGRCRVLTRDADSALAHSALRPRPRTTAWPEPTRSISFLSTSLSVGDSGCGLTSASETLTSTSHSRVAPSTRRSSPATLVTARCWPARTRPRLGRRSPATSARLGSAATPTSTANAVQHGKRGDAGSEQHRPQGHPAAGEHSLDARHRPAARASADPRRIRFLRPTARTPTISAKSSSTLMVWDKPPWVCRCEHGCAGIQPAPRRTVTMARRRVLDRRSRCPL